MKFYKMSVVLACGLLLTACSDENPWLSGEGTGGIAPVVVANTDVVSARPALRSDESIDAPVSDLFAVKLSKTDGSYSKEWENLSAFPKDASFPIGAYTFEASYGSLETEGFESPYFYGAEQITVKEDETTTVRVTASLANAMVSFDYTEDFKHFFPQYSAMLHAAGGAFIEFAADETRPAFVQPGNVNITLSLTKQNGLSATFQPAEFTAEARHHYHITFDANSGQTGDVQLSIVFDDTLEQEDVVIDLTDDLMLSPAPAVTPSGFTSGQTIDLLEGSRLETPLQAMIIANGGIKDVMLTTDAPTLVNAFGNEINLMTLSAAQQQQLEAAGLKVTGLWNGNVAQARMARIDFTDLVASLSGNATYRFGLVVKDKLTKVNEPLQFSVRSIPVEVSFGQVNPSIIGSTLATMTVSYNGSDFKNNISVEALNKYGVWELCPVTVNSQEGNTYNITVEIPDMPSDVKVRLKFKDAVKDEAEISRISPDYSIAVDAFARHAVVKINASADDIAAVTSVARIFVNEPGASMKRDVAHGLITVSGLTPQKAYTFRSCIKDDEYVPDVAATTEADAAVANGDFANVTRTINISKINAGGQFGTSKLIKYFNTTSIIADEPDGWASVNALTCAESSTTKNTWFMVPSTMVLNGAVTIRSVAYDHAGTLPDFSAAAATGYSKNAPKSFAGRASGELFLGSYPQGGQRTDGIAFASRPSSVTFDYSYTPYNGEQGEAYIELLDASGRVVGSASMQLGAQASMTNVTLAVPSYLFGIKAATMRLCFRSTKRGVTPSTLTRTGTDLKDNNTIIITGTTIAANEYKSLSVGSVLVVDNVKLNY